MEKVRDTQKVDKSVSNNALIYFLIILSGVAYGLSFLFIEKFWWTIFFSIYLIYYSALRFELKFRHGFVWAFTLFGLSLSGIFYSLFQMAEAGAIYVLLIALLSLIYVSVYGGLLFKISQFFSNYTFKKLFKNEIMPRNFSLLASVLIWSIILVIFFEFLLNALLWPFGILEGLILAHPLLPLTQHPNTLFVLLKLGVTLATFCLCFFLGLLAIPKERHLPRLILPLIVFFALYIKAFRIPKEKRPHWLKEIVYVPKSFYNGNNFDKSIKQAAVAINKITKEHNKIKLILFPESALYLCCLDQWKEKIKEWSNINRLSNVSIIIGGLRSANKETYNTVYWIQNGKIKGWYDKQHAMVLTERLPYWADTPELRKLYYSVRPIIDVGKSKRPTFKISNNLSVIPYICSEIFFKNYPDFDYPKEYPIISLCNDNWVFMPYLEKLMRAVNKFRAIQWSRHVIYVSYSHGFLYMPSGKRFKIKKA